jgi:hypothetical protein
MGKSLLKSKTFWVNSLTAVVAAVTAVTNLDFIQDNPQVVAIGGMFLGFVNIALRVITKEPIK